VTQAVIDVLFDKGIINRFATMAEYLKHEKAKHDPKELSKLQQLVEKKIFEQVSYYAHLMYHGMETSDNWGDPGEQQVKIAFCRNLLKIDPEKQLSEEDAVNFMIKVEETLQKLGINTLSAEAAASELKNFKFMLFGKAFESYRSLELHKILKFTGSSQFLHGGQYGADQEFIMGEGKFSHKKGYDVTFISKELIRTPNNVMSMAAIIGNRNVFVRMESLKTIFAQKWLQIFQYSDEEKETIKEDINWNIAEGIKQRVLKFYDAKDKKSLKKIEDTFLKDMAETILFHELGHGIIQHDILPLELGAIGEASKIYGENIYTAILEFLADFAPPKDGILGPLHNMIAVSKKDVQRASRMYYMYLSDTWFFNTEDEYMYTYSDLMALILLKYISPNGDIQFKELDKDLQYRTDRVKGDTPTLFERIYDLYVWDVQEIKNLVEHAKFKVAGDTLDYKKVRDVMIEQFRRNDGFVHEDSYEFLVPFWTNMLGYIQQLSDSKKKVADYIHNQERKNLMKMLVLSCGRKKAESLKFDHRKYLIERMKDLGILAHKT